MDAKGVGAEETSVSRPPPISSAKAKRKMRRRAALVTQCAARRMKERKRLRRDATKRSRKRERCWAVTKLQAVVRENVARSSSLHVWKQMPGFGGRHDRDYREGLRLATDSYMRCEI